MEALLPVQKVHPLVFSFWVAPSAFEVNNGIEYLLAHTEHKSACCPNISASACLNDIISHRRLRLWGVDTYDTRRTLRVTSRSAWFYRPGLLLEDKVPTL